ncbi:MAG: hypothetical protein AAFV43_03495 [Planctomycetota bacterium]
MAVNKAEPGFSLRDQKEIAERISRARQRKLQQLEDRNGAARRLHENRRLKREEAEHEREAQTAERKARLEELAREVECLHNVTPVTVEDVHAMLSAIGVMELFD